MIAQLLHSAEMFARLILFSCPQMTACQSQVRRDSFFDGIGLGGLGERGLCFLECGRQRFLRLLGVFHPLGFGSRDEIGTGAEFMGLRLFAGAACTFGFVECIPGIGLRIFPLPRRKQRLGQC